MVDHAFLLECAQTVREEHVEEFELLSALSCRISYDNTQIAITQLTHRRGDMLTDLF